LIDRINEGYCVDDSRLYVSGASNGGMFTYYLASLLPELINGYFLEYGQPMVGWLNTPKEAAGSYMISLHGRSDTTLPPAGGIDGDDMWIYESIPNMFYLWGMVQGCDITSWNRVKTPFDDVPGNLNLACYEYTKGCKTGRSMRCEYDGKHAEDPVYMANIAWWLWSTKYEKET